LKNFIKLILNRLGWERLSYPVPSHANTLSYSLGGFTLVGFGILILSGIFLAQYYNPSPEGANRSVHYINEQVYLGWFIRGLHFWSMQFVVVCVSLHVLRTFVTASFKNPREINWLSGVILLGIIGGFIFTGTTLKWDQEAYEALEHNLWVAKKLGPFGFVLSENFTESVSMLGRLYGMHTSFLPIIFFPLIALHLALQQFHGLSQKPLDQNKMGFIPFTAHMKHLVFNGLGLFALISTLALFILPPLGNTPVIGIEVTKPPWMFLWIYALENRWVPFLIFAPAILFLLLIMVPFFERTDVTIPQKRKLPIAIFLLGVLFIVFLIILGYFTTEGHTM